jgi:hypothetical protein
VWGVLGRNALCFKTSQAKIAKKTTYRCPKISWNVTCGTPVFGWKVKPHARTDPIGTVPSVAQRPLAKFHQWMLSQDTDDHTNPKVLGVLI